MFKRKLLGIIAIMVAMLLLPTVYADEYTDLLDKFAPNGEVVVNSIPPTNENEMYAVLYDYLAEGVNGTYINNNYKNKIEIEGGYLSIEDVSTDYKTAKIVICDFERGPVASKNVTFKYNYNDEIYNKIKEYSKKIPANQPMYYISDLELLNFWINGEKDGYDNIDNYSTELKEVFNNSNLSFFVDNRAGFPGNIVEGRLGIATIIYDGTIYYINPMLGTQTRSIIYVDDNETDIVKAAQKRINDYVGHDKYVITEDITVTEYMENYIQSEIAAKQREYEERKREYGNTQLPDYLTSFEAFCEANYFDPNNITSEEFDLLEDYRDEKLYKVTINGVVRRFLIIKDKTGMKKPKFGSIDIETDVSVTSDDSKIPLDTLVSAKLLTSGDIYDNIRKVIGKNKSITYDIMLQSKSIADKITKLDNGKFLVSLPVSAELSGKELTVYYISPAGDMEEHNVTVKDGYATFETDHFSAYTLVEKDVTKTSNPSTGDSIGITLIVFALSASGLAITFKKLHS